MNKEREVNRDVGKNRSHNAFNIFCDLVIRLVNNIHCIKSSSILHEGEKIYSTQLGRAEKVVQIRCKTYIWNLTVSVELNIPQKQPI